HAMSTLVNMVRFVLWILVICMIGGCKAESPRVHFILPNGYRGLFVITTQADGARLQTSEGRIVLAIPENGNLAIRDSAVLFEWHSVSAAFADETQIRFGDHDNLPADSVACWDVGNETDRPDKPIWYFIGTYREKCALGTRRELPSRP